MAPRPQPLLQFHGHPNLPSDTHNKPKKRTRDPTEDSTGIDYSNKRLSLMDPSIEPSYDPRGFACPFRKAIHRKFDLKDSCARRSWPSIPRLKEHLYRCHVTVSCERCFAPFKSHSELVAHKRQATSCRRMASESSTSEGVICDTKMNELKSRKNLSHHDDREKWMRIWKILFPDSPLPESPYADHLDGMRKSGLMEDFESFLQARVPMLTKSMAAIYREHLEETDHLRQVVSDWLGAAFQQYREEFRVHQPCGERTISSTEEGFVEPPRLIPFNDSWALQPSPISNISTNYPTTCGLRGLCGNNVHLTGNIADSSSHDLWASPYVLPPAHPGMAKEADGIYGHQTPWSGNTPGEICLPAPDEQPSILPLQRGPEWIIGDGSPSFAGIPTSAAKFNSDVPVGCIPHNAYSEIPCRGHNSI